MILFDRLIHTGRVAADDRQVKPVVVFAYITVDAAGRFLEFRLGDPKVKVPIFQTDRGSTILACIGPTDTATYVLGISDKSKVELKLAARAATLRAAAETAPPEMARALEAIARFSLSPTERAAAIAAMGRKTPGPADYVSVQMVGFDLDPADRFLWRVHQRRSEENQGVGSGDGVIGDCPFCGAEDVPMTRLYGKVGGAFLIAFNEPSFEAYGRTQGYVAPSCLDCSSALGRGASWAVGNAAYRPAPMSNVTMVWWTPERAATDQPWAHWNKQWPKEGQPPSTEEALGHLPESTDLLSDLERSIRRQWPGMDIAKLVVIHRAHGLRGAVDPFALRNSWPKGYPAPDAARVKTLLGQGASALATEIARTKTRDVRVLAGQSAVCLAVAAYYGWRGLPIGSLPAILAPGSPAIFVTQPVRT